MAQTGLGTGLGSIGSLEHTSRCSLRRYPLRFLVVSVLQLLLVMLPVVLAYFPFEAANQPFVQVLLAKQVILPIYHGAQDDVRIKYQLENVISSYTKAAKEIVEARLEEEQLAKTTALKFGVTNTINDHSTQINRMLDVNQELLEGLLLANFKVTAALACSVHNEYNGTKNIHSSTSTASPLSTYDDGVAILAQVTRDWTPLGESVRHSTYAWTLERLVTGVCPDATVLVPGAGAGRLAWEMAACGFRVETNDASASMLATSFNVLKRLGSIQHPRKRKYLQNNLFPHAHDRSENELDGARRSTATMLDLAGDTLSGRGCSSRKRPLCEAKPAKGSLSFVLGDFVASYGAQRSWQARTVACVVTCFFLDTASNIYDYVATVHHVLKTKGVWINVGPLQWHANALLHPTVAELKHMILAFGFKLVEWAVDDEPLNYRSDHDASLRSDAYRPLRFVAKKL